VGVRARRKYQPDVSALAESGRADPKDIKPVVLQDFTALGTALANNQVDVASLPTANAQDALASGAKIIYRGAQIGVPGINTWAVPKSVLADKKKSAAISDLLTRLVAYWDWYAKNPEKVAQTLVSKVKQSPKLAKYNAAAGRSRFFPIDKALFDIEQPVSEALASGGLIKKSVDVTLEYDDRFNDVIIAAAKKQGTSTDSAVLQK
jgi:sulfonate transport system substrate-binding protein